MKTDNLHKIIFENFIDILQKDRKKSYYLLYYSFLETILLLVLPFASSFIINSLLAHSTISLMILGLIVSMLLFMVVILQLIKEYIIEKFQQTIFVRNAVDVGRLAISKCEVETQTTTDKSNRYMNYFFEVLTLQKILPMTVLDGVALVMKVVVSILLLLAFDVWLFMAGITFFGIYIWVILLLGKQGFVKAIERSDAKHEAIYKLQHICDDYHSNHEVLEKLDGYLKRFIFKRQAMFKVIFRQFAWSYLMEGVLISGFLMLGGILVINGALPVGEFVAAEILVISLVYALHSFVKQIDYIYDMAEGIYKIDKLSHVLEDTKHE